MSATIVNFPHPPLRPNLESCREAVERCEHDPIMLLFVAYCGVSLVRNQEAPTEQAAVDMLAISFFALAELLGVPDVAEGLL